jgi:hypothetical protein
VKKLSLRELEEYVQGQLAFKGQKQDHRWVDLFQNSPVTPLYTVSEGRPRCHLSAFALMLPATSSECKMPFYSEFTAVNLLHGKPAN